jgi:hypothetical protein
MSNPRRHPFRRCLALLLALLLPLHALGATCTAVRGPAHVHHAPAGTQLVLLDLRRAAPTDVRRPHLHAAPAWTQAHAAVAHHHHDAGDASVVRTARDAAAALAASDEHGTSAGFAGFIALVTEPLAWKALRIDHVTRAHRPWAVLTHEGGPPERPPRSA